MLAYLHYREYYIHKQYQNHHNYHNYYNYTKFTGLWAGYLVLHTFYTTSESSWWKQDSEYRVLLGGLQNSLSNFLRKTLDSPSLRASGEGGILHTEFRQEGCVSHLGGAENAKKSMSKKTCFWHRFFGRSSFILKGFLDDFLQENIRKKLLPQFQVTASVLRRECINTDQM